MSDWSEIRTHTPVTNWFSNELTQMCDHLSYRGGDERHPFKEWSYSRSEIIWNAKLKWSREDSNRSPLDPKSSPLPQSYWGNDVQSSILSRSDPSSVTKLTPASPLEGFNFLASKGCFSAFSQLKMSHDQPSRPNGRLGWSTCSFSASKRPWKQPFEGRKLKPSKGDAGNNHSNSFCVKACLHPSKNKQLNNHLIP